MTQAKHFSAALPMAASPGEARMLVSSESIDFEGDRVLAAGLDVDLRNLPLLWSHDRESIPIGRVVAVDARPGVGVEASWIWNDGDEFGARVRRAWDAGFVRGASIGFLSTERAPNQFGGYDHKKWRLVEISLTGVPANADCVRELRARGLFPGADRLVVRVQAPAPAEGPLVVLADDPPAGLQCDGLPLTHERARALIGSEITAALGPALEGAMRRGLSKTLGRLTGRVD